MPIIAVTASHAREAAPYMAAVAKHAAQTRLLTPDGFGGVAAAMDGVSGLLLCGGVDVHPKYYGQEIDPAAHVKSWPERDEMELALLRDALARDMPVLAICRGMQVLNVAFGGSLIQDLPDHAPGTDPAGSLSSQPPAPASADDSVMHQIYVSPGSRLGAVIGGGGVYRVNSRHHQGLKERHRAPGLLSSAYQPQDGIVEGLEGTRHTWVLGVQCHPEREREMPRSFEKLFKSFTAWATAFPQEAVTR